MTTDVSPILDKSTFAKELCAWRAAQGRGNWTQKQAAKHLGVELGTYRNWEQGKHEPASYVLSLLRQTISKPTTK
jgi:DNA-binding transcriptional regulator YiaG